MAINQAKYILFHYLATKSRNKTATGFTLPELLVGMVVAGIALYAVLSLVVSLLTTEQRETAKSQTQQEMAQALDYMAAELREAVYIYPGDCFQPGNIPNCPNFNFVTNTPNVQPVLAFWKLERFEADELSADNEDTTLQTNLAFYTLVIYSIRPNTPNSIWQENLGRITRFTLPKYQDLQDTTAETPGYNNFTGSFATWNSTNINFSNDVVLVDGVDLGLNPGRVNCPDNYTATPPANATIDNLSSFYACISNPGGSNVQEAVVFLRGNAAQRAGAKGSRNPIYLPSLQTRVQARTRFGQQ
ncbi:prepilin-type N-terminal cleavage/methylation domain-containing protein [Laspinema sp. A4]|uniref:PilW family protein n=1 Tax=Laspinema sp. D2d TaxID=2953686 RepID=UPI0021BA55E1|nr:prepilin-type N-terminal cleavage/methylation domain-containing protein [Laspinema sp. D2d]MCT7982826.1 prepilin-type N-terminal cleavage/methylation domain-containing protein [Laspinema sp. D2d]